MNLQTITKIGPDCIWRDGAGLVTQMLGSAAGSRKFYVNIDIVSPGAYSTKYHCHSQQEEFFFIITGTGTLRLNGEEIPVGPGDFFAKLPGQNCAHTFFNSGSAALKILDIGSAESEDTCYYPDEDMVLHKSNGDSFAFKQQSCEENWSSDPNIYET